MDDLRMVLKARETHNILGDPEILNCKLPRINCPWPVKCNRFYPIISKKTYEWAEGYNITYQEWVKAYKKHDFPLMTSLMHANSKDYKRLLNISKFWYWIFMVDDIEERAGQSGYKDVDAQLWFKGILDVIYEENFNPKENRTDLHYLWAKSLYYLWNEMNMHPLVRKRLKKAIKDWSDAIKYIATNKWRTIGAPLKDYLEIRFDDSGVMTMPPMFEYQLDIQLSDDILNHTLLKRLCRNFVESAFLVNDVKSFKKEHLNNNRLNLIEVIKYNDKCSIKEALNKGIVMAKKVINEMDEVYEALKVSELWLNQDVVNYVNAHIDAISGMIYWSQVNNRYGFDYYQYYKGISRRVPIYDQVNINVLEKPDGINWNKPNKYID